MLMVESVLIPSCNESMAVASVMPIDWTTFTGAWAKVRFEPYVFAYAVATNDGLPDSICDSSDIDAGKVALWIGTLNIPENEPWLLEVKPVNSD